MKRFLILLVFLGLSCTALSAQEFRSDSTRTSPVDSTLLGRSVLSVMGPGVTVHQSAAMKSAFDRYVADNANKKLVGYRIRVFFDNGQSARNRSEAIARSISYSFPGIGVYRTFESPNFKVMVGDFRTKAEALKVYQALKVTYPTALILKENINYPQ